MPELPEAEVVACQLRQRLVGAELKDCWIGRPDIVRQGLSTLDWYRGTRLTAVTRRGKSVVLSCSRDGETRYVVAELGMTGLLLLRPLKSAYLKHTHVVFSFTQGRDAELVYWNPRRFGRVYLLDQPAFDEFLSRRFGCDALAVSWDEFLTLARSRRGRLKALLMHQQVIAGIGNIYANEILFRARLHPYRIAGRLRPQTIRRLYDTMQEVLQEAIEDGGSSVRDFIAPDGTKGLYKQRHLVYNKTGHPCPNKCGTTIRRIIGERSSFYCPSCQRI
jgi:formamidopyrimidine-DNA glycosylase